jgi:hypothetical protein
MRQEMPVSDHPIVVPVERRQWVRFSTSLPVFILVSEGKPLIPCTLMDVSPQGCRVRLEARAKVPEYFILLLTSAGTVRRLCKVIWRQEDLLGCAFQNETPAPAQSA